MEGVKINLESVGAATPPNDPILKGIPELLASLNEQINLAIFTANSIKSNPDVTASTMDKVILCVAKLEGAKSRLK